MNVHAMAPKVRCPPRRPMVVSQPVCLSGLLHKIRSCKGAGGGLWWWNGRQLEIAMPDLAEMPGWRSCFSWLMQMDSRGNELIRAGGAGGMH